MLLPGYKKIEDSLQFNIGEREQFKRYQLEQQPVLVQFISTPSSAVLVHKRQSYSANNTLALKAMPHQFVIAAEGYITQSFTFTFTAGLHTGNLYRTFDT